VSDAPRANPITVTIGDGVTLAAGSTNMVLSAATLPEASPAEYMALANDVPPGHAAVFSTDGTAIYVNVIPVKWIEESAEKTGLTGSWSEDVSYEDGRAYLFGDYVFTPKSVSTADVVTVEFKTQFYELDDFEPDATVQAAVRLSTNGCFQVWTLTGNTPSWLDVDAEGMTPESGSEYSLRFTFDYQRQTYCVEVEKDGTWLSLAGRVVLNAPSGDQGTDRPTKFPLAVSKNRVSSVTFTGETFFTSLVGENIVAVGFGESEVIALNGATETLSAAKAAWLNGLGDKATVVDRIKTISADKFNEAYLLNIDIMHGDFTYTFGITGITVKEDEVDIAVELTRSGDATVPINGTLKFYGSATLQAFLSSPAELGEATLTNENFGEGTTATATIPLKGETRPAFFNAKIE